MSSGSFVRASSTSSGFGSFWDSKAKIADFSNAIGQRDAGRSGDVDRLLDELSRGRGGQGGQKREGCREGGRGEAEETTGHHVT